MYVCMYVCVFCVTPRACCLFDCAMFVCLVHAQVVSVNRSAADMKLNSDMFWKWYVMCICLYCSCRFRYLLFPVPRVY